MSQTLRAMTATDLNAVLALAAASIEAPQWTRRDYEQVLLSTPADALLRFGVVAPGGSGLDGFAVINWLRMEPVAEIESLVVAQDARRQGIGAALTSACMAWARAAGASAVRLEVRASNGPAIALYRRLGFTTAGIRAAYYSSPVEDALLLQATL